MLAGLAVLAVLSLTPASAAENPSTPDASAAALEQLRAANVARAELARAESEWRGERDRLQAAIAATNAELARLQRDATEAEGQRDRARARFTTLGEAGEIDALRARLGEAGIKVTSALAALARSVPPGTIAVPATGLAGEAAFDAALRALDAGERAAGTVTVEVVSGTRDGHPEAVKLLRIAGAVAWWVALDGSAAGTARMVDGGLRLESAHDERARLDITQALAQAEGRAQPTVMFLPAPTATGGTP